MTHSIATNVSCQNLPMNSTLSTTEILPVLGFSAAAFATGVKKRNKLDAALIIAEKPVPAAAIFTQSKVVAAPVILSRKNITSGTARGFFVNSGNANACTGEAGMAAAQEIATAYASAVGCEPDELQVASTGVIGVLPCTEKIIAPAAEMAGLLSPDAPALVDVAEAFMTTDLSVKIISTTFEAQGITYTATGIAKGSGMIRPNMATMIGLILTDAPLTSSACKALLGEISENTFNAVTVDGDTSTNDTLLLMASGAAGGPNIEPGSGAAEIVRDALFGVCEALATMIARDGEGATKLVEVIVTGAARHADAKRVAYTIAESPLVKTAIFGRDANWGRVAGAAGRAGVEFDQANLAISFAGILVCKHGTAVDFDEAEALEALSQPDVTIHVDLGVSASQAGDVESTRTICPAPGAARILTCDLTYDYIRINGDYRS